MNTIWSRVKVPLMIFGGAVLLTLGIWVFIASLQFMASEPPVTNQPDARANLTEAPPKDRLTCNDQELFADTSFGMQFCYPSDWGVATLRDAKMSADDTGSREIVIFTDNPQLRVGAVSGDWTTTTPRDGVCFDPSPQGLIVGTYNTEWHDLVGSGDDIAFAIRHIGSADQGYDMIEEVSNLLQSGVCAKSTKLVNGTRYQYVTISYYQDFDPSRGSSTPSMHIADPLKLFSQQSRDQFESLAKSIRKYD